MSCLRDRLIAKAAKGTFRAVKDVLVAVKNTLPAQEKLVRSYIWVLELRICGRSAAVKARLIEAFLLRCLFWFWLAVQEDLSCIAKGMQSNLSQQIS
ncbi:hypothetical protein HMPREF9069_01370 [Atopobium sp. oral taxon 810 str. F0209]|nr:hypothetical protein HMPREF9069_01370 [Atopobium sp. oral taxon 810 str. F0209]